MQSLFQCDKLVLFTHTRAWGSVPSIQRASSHFPAHNNSMKNDWRVLTGSSSGFTSPDALRPSAAQQEDKLEGCPDLHSAKECANRMPKVWEFHESYFYKEFQTCDKQRSNRMCVFLSVYVYVSVHTDTVILVLCVLLSRFPPLKLSSEKNFIIARKSARNSKRTTSQTKTFSLSILKDISYFTS